MTPITVDSGVGDGLTNVLTSLKTQVFSYFGTDVLIIGGGIMITLAVVYFVIRHIRGMAKV